jgi:alkylation response protein AidB-like acyl-CoA dehydrogenase
MNLELTDEQLALRDTVRRFLAERASVPDHVRPMLDDSAGTTDTVWRGLADLGTTGLLVPQEYGGSGMTMVEAGVVLEELGAALHPGPWFSSAVAAPRALARFGACDKRLWCGLADGSVTAAIGGITDPGHHMVTAIDRADGVVLRGDVAVPDAEGATVLLVLGAEREHDGGSLFTVDISSPGIARHARDTIDRTRKSCHLTLDDVPAERLGTATPEAIQALVDDVLAAQAADALGAARAVRDLAVEYTTTRRQFGRPIGAFQAVQHLCVDMYETVELARGGVLHALWAADAAGADERHLAALRAKAFAGRLAAVADTAIQVFGGIGYTWEHDAHLYLKRLLSWQAFRGGPGRYLEEVGRRLVRTHR